MNLKTNQKNDQRGVRREAAIVAGSPIEGYGAVVSRPQALSAESDDGEGAEEGGEDGLEVAVGGDDGEGFVGSLQAGEVREQRFASADDLEGVGFRVSRGIGGAHGGMKRW